MRLRNRENKMANPMEQMLLSMESSLNKINSRLYLLERDDHMGTLEFNYSMSTLSSKAVKLQNVVTDPLDAAHASELLKVTLAKKDNVFEMVMGYLNCVIKELTVKMAKNNLPMSHNINLLLEGFLTERELKSAVPK
jgi:hypothetical protein